MRVTITIEDGGGSGEVALAGADGHAAVQTRTPGAIGLPYVKGPGLLAVPTPDGREEVVNLDPQVAEEIERIVEGVRGGAQSAA